MWDAGPPTPWDRNVDDPLETHSYPKCYNEFRRCRSNRLGVGRGVPTNFGDAGPRPIDTGMWPSNVLLTHICQIQSF